MAATEILSEKRGQGIVLTFNRPNAGNALNYDMANQLFTIIKNVTTDKSIRAVLLRGAGDHFMDGMDMSPFVANVSNGAEKVNQLVLPYHSIIREMQTMDKPVIAAVHGSVTGAGLSLMLACDLVIAARNTKFKFNYCDYATSPDGACSYYLPRKIGLSKAVELMMLGAAFDAARAESLSLVNRVVDDEKLRDEAFQWFEQLSEGPTKAYAAVKKLALLSFEQDIVKQLSVEHLYMGQSWRSFDFREAVKAQATNRPPKFTGN